MYDDAYATCDATFATLCVYGLPPEDVTRDLGLSPTESQHRGDVRRGGAAPIPIDGWFLSSQLAVASKDVRRHLDWILDQLGGRGVAFSDLGRRGAHVMMSCYWRSAMGQGGPTISPAQMKKLAELGIELVFDLY